jgi:hypothetical protein
MLQLTQLVLLLGCTAATLAAPLDRVPRQQKVVNGEDAPEDKYVAPRVPLVGADAMKASVKASVNTIR